MNRCSRGIYFLQRILIDVGILALAYVAGTLVYSNLYQLYQAQNLQRQIESIAFAATPPPSGGASALLNEGDVVGKIEVPRIGVSVVVLEGVEQRTLEVGAGHVPETPLPGENGNSSIAAHRDTYFRKLRGVRPGDRLQFSSARGIYDYLVESTEIVHSSDTHVLQSRGYPELTLITCHPFYFIGSAPDRFIVHARPAGGKALP